MEDEKKDEQPKVEEQPKVDEKKKAKEQPKVDETKNEQPKVDEDKKLSKLVNDLKQDYDNKISAIQEKYTNEIAQRDDIIRQLMTGSDTAKQPTPSFVDNINNKRNFKKW